MKPGLHFGVPAEVYHRDPAEQPSLSSGIAKILLRQSPLMAWHCHPRLNKDYREDQDAKFDLGTSAHALLLENDPASIVIVEADDWRTKAAKEQRDTARAAGKTPLLARHYAAVERMVEAAEDFLDSSPIRDLWYAEDAKSEVTACWEESGIWFRCRFDRLAPSVAFTGDYKSTEDVSPDGFGRQILRMGYHIADAFYRRGARANGIETEGLVFLAQSVSEPHECTLHGCDRGLQEIADAEVERAIDIWRQCIKANQWPSYDNRIHYAQPTAWMVQEHETNAGILREFA